MPFTNNWYYILQVFINLLLFNNIAKYLLIVKCYSM